MRKLINITLLILLATMVSLSAKADEVMLTNANIVGDGSHNQSYRSWTITDNNGKTWNAYAIKNYHSNATSSNHFLQIKKMITVALTISKFLNMVPKSHLLPCK